MSRRIGWESQWVEWGCLLCKTKWWKSWTLNNGVWCRPSRREQWPGGLAWYRELPCLHLDPVGSVANPGNSSLEQSDVEVMDWPAYIRYIGYPSSNVAELWQAVRQTCCAMGRRRLPVLIWSTIWRAVGRRKLQVPTGSTSRRFVMGRGLILFPSF